MSLHNCKNDFEIMKNVGKSFNVTDVLLGHGGYGDVFLASDENGRAVAIKCCKITREGIPNILETSIMGSMIHPYLNSALRIHATSEKLYIIQNLAITDLARYIRSDRKGYRPSLNKLCYWCFCLVQGLAALHMNNIIHCDIKANNILIFEDESIKLSDYSLSLKKWDQNDKFAHSVCTSTHRPLECLTGDCWDESLDIWSLGCTFYEIAYGELLFPYQGNISSVRKKEIDAESKLNITKKLISAIISWGELNDFSQTYDYALVEHKPVTPCKDYYKSEMLEFNNLLISMLKVYPEYRPNVNTLLKHEFFKNMIPKTYLSITRPSNKITLTENARIYRYIQRYTNNSKIQEIAFDIYSRCNNIRNGSEQDKASACVWIATKLVFGRQSNIEIYPKNITSLEREICHNLHFRLHSM